MVLASFVQIPFIFGRAVRSLHVYLGLCRDCFVRSIYECVASMALSFSNASNT